MQIPAHSKYGLTFDIYLLLREALHCRTSRRWKAAKDGGAAESGVAELTLKDKTGAEIEKRLPGGKVKKKAKAEVVLETSTRSKKKCVTTIQGEVYMPTNLLPFVPSAISTDMLVFTPSHDKDMIVTDDSCY